MVAAALFHHRLHLNPRISTANHRREILHDVLLSMRFGLTRDLLLKRSFAYNSITAINSSGSRQQNSKSPVTMATKNDNLVETATEEKDKKKEEEVSLPPPPEKPEAGDCCGSGCVRCVWDVYYDELEEYNKLISPKSAENKSN